MHLFRSPSTKGSLERRPETGPGLSRPRSMQSRGAPRRVQHSPAEALEWQQSGPPHIRDRDALAQTAKTWHNYGLEPSGSTPAHGIRRIRNTTVEYLALTADRGHRP